jgi:3-oxoadipate enol-lactonase
MPHARINGVDIYFEKHGQAGEPLVFVHGYTGDVTDWRHQVGPFSRDYQVLIFDLRGHGRSEAPTDRSTYTIEQMADDTEALVAEIGFERYHLLGHSMGGAVVQEIALRSPGRLLSLTLQNTAPLFDLFANPMIRQFMEARTSVAETQGMSVLATWKSPFPNPPHMTQERQDEVAERLGRMSVDAFVGCQQALNQWAGAVDRLPSISTPTLAIVGDLDAGPLVKAAHTFAETIPNATLAVIPETGHSPQYERPELFNAALKRHLEASPACGSPK